MDYRVLGPLEVRDGDESLPLAGAKQRALLALLLLHANRVLSRDRLIDELWGDQPPATAVQSLQVYVSRLRKLLPPETLRTQAPGYLLEINPEELDLRRFERLLAEGHEALAEGDAERAARALHEALALWRGPALTEFAFEPFAQAEIGRLEDLRLAAVEERIEADLALGRHADLIGELEALIAENPHRERLRGQLMLALYRSGRQAEALEAYQSARRALVDELGIEAGHELQTLQRAILTHDPEISFRLPRQRQPAARLPSPSSALIGRSHEVVEARSTLHAQRIVTLVGAGGSGKTRLALAVAAAAAEEFADGVVWVSLQALTAPELVLSAIAEALGATTDLAEHLEHKQTLLVLDNFEQVVSAAPEVADLLRVAPDVKVLATSREPLRLSGEHEYPVLPLREKDAVSLFSERARAVARDFQPNNVVVEICRRVDCLPLAIELAAARTKLLSPEALLDRLGDRLPILTGGARDVPARHQTLRATIEWSHDLLDGSERILFAQLGVFVGGFTLEAAQAVCDADLDRIESLVEKSLVLIEHDRFSMLQTIHEYAHERLEEMPEAEEVRSRHAAHLLSVAVAFAPSAANEENPLHGHAFRERADRLADDHDNFRSALAWALDRRERELALRLATAATMGRLRSGRTVMEARRVLETALALEGEGSAVAEAIARRRAGWLALLVGENERSVILLEESLALFRAAGELADVAHVTDDLAEAVRAAGNPNRARLLYEESIALCRELSLSVGLCWALRGLGELERDEGRYERAAELLEDCLQRAEHADDLGSANLCRHALADLRLDEGHTTRATALYRTSLAQFWIEGGGDRVAACIGGLSATAAKGGDVERAGRLWGALERIEEGRAAALQVSERTRYETLLGAVDQEALARAIERGRGMTIDEAVEYALAEA